MACTEHNMELVTATEDYFDHENNLTQMDCKVWACLDCGYTEDYEPE
jgi:predicted nucleic-acid-binding Zn-ribbon protein